MPSAFFVCHCDCKQNLPLKSRLNTFSILRNLRHGIVKAMLNKILHQFFPLLFQERFPVHLPLVLAVFFKVNVQLMSILFSVPPHEPNFQRILSIKKSFQVLSDFLPVFDNFFCPGVFSRLIIVYIFPSKFINLLWESS